MFYFLTSSFNIPSAALRLEKHPRLSFLSVCVSIIQIIYPQREIFKAKTVFFMAGDASCIILYRIIPKIQIDMSKIFGNVGFGFARILNVDVWI